MTVDISHEVLLKDNKEIVKLAHGRQGTHPEAENNFAGELFLEIGDEEEIFSDNDIREMQETNKEIKLLTKCVQQQEPIGKWPTELVSFKRYAQNLAFIGNILYYLKGGDKDERLPVPVVSLNSIIGLTLIVHREHLLHSGKHKMWRFVKNVAFHPELINIAYDL